MGFCLELLSSSPWCMGIWPEQDPLLWLLSGPRKGAAYQPTISTLGTCVSLQGQDTTEHEPHPHPPQICLC